MNQIDNPSAFREWMSNQFSSSLQGIALTITQIKSLVYSLIDIGLPLQQPLSIPSDYHSIMVACKRIHDDLKRTEWILHAHVKARHCAEELNEENMRNMDRRINAQIGSKRISKSQTINANGSTAVSSLVGKSNFNFGSFEIKISKQNRGEEEEKREQKGEDQAAIAQEYINREVQRCTSEAMLGSKEVEIDARIQKLRKNRQEDIHQFMENNEQCLLLIKNIRENLVGRFQQ